MELGPISASLGAMGSLAWKLDELLATRHRALRGVVMDVIEELRTDLHILHNLLLKLSNEQDPPPTARYWMKDVRDLSYDMEDCADQFVHADACAKIRRANRRKIITRLKINRLPERRKWRPWITNKVSEFRTRAQEAIQRYWRYKFDYCASNPGYSRVGHELPTLYTEPGDLVGMEGPMNELDRWLTNGEEQLKVVSIVGVGGVGKTTLAQKLWGKLQGQFDCRAFVRTAQKPDMRGILRSILSQVRRHQLPGPGEMHHLIHELRQYLQAKRYFVIIDDLWATSVWDVVSRAFPEGNCCSRIITTTEIMEVALACCGYCHEHIFKMEPLSDDDSEKLLLQRILVSGNQNPQNFNDVVYQITRKCGGLPLAIIIVGSLLASQPDLDQWGFAQNSFGSYLRANPTMEGFMGQILNISFNSLPHYLKTCLLYLSTYPEGYIFLKDHLVKQWVAESFICAKEGEDIEEVAGSYFDELVSTGLIQVDINYNYELSSYSVHHMVLDLITYKSIEENFITIVDYSQTTTPLADKVRRLSLHFGSATYATIPASTRLSQVRTLFFFGLFNCMPSFVVFKLLRVLNLHFWGDLENTSFNLTEICELFQLRYLQVTCNVTVKLPDKIEAMKHLETLEINARVCAVPPDIVRLSSLLHLCLGGGTNLPDGIGCMRSLRTLKYFDLGNNSEDNLRGLGELTNLRDLHLTYSTLPSSEHLKRNLIALASSLGKLGNLKSLTLTPGTAGTVVLIDGLDGMSNLVFLERLELLPPICIFSILPIWFAQLDKICIMKVAVRELRRDDIDILSGLPSLTVLSLCVQTAPEGRIVFNDGAFPVLKYFKFSCGVLCMSFMSGAMPNLRRLKLCFNTHIGEKYSNMLAGIEHLLHLQDITGRIGAATESDRRAAESAIKDVISKHPRCPRFNVQRVDPVEEEHGKQEKGSSGEKHGVLEKAEDTNKHEDSRLSQLPDLPSAVASHRLKSGFDIQKLQQEVKTRWLKPREVLNILQNHELFPVTHKTPQRPQSGSWFLFNRRVLRYFRNDGYEWRKKKNGKTNAEAHERLKVDNVQALNCYYAHADKNPTFQRRIYWILEPAYEHIVFVHYRDVREGSISVSAVNDSSTSNQNGSTSRAEAHSSPGLTSAPRPNLCSPGSGEEVSSQIVTINNETNNTSGSDWIQHCNQVALRKLKMQLSLEDKEHRDVNTKEVLLNNEPMLEETDTCRNLGDIFSGLEFGEDNHSEGSHPYPDAIDVLKNSDAWLEEDQLEVILRPASVTANENQWFRIHEVSPEWAFCSESTKVVIAGDFVCNLSHCSWAILFGDVKVPVEIVQQGVIRCHTPCLGAGKVRMCMIDGNGKPCSDDREFEFHEKPTKNMIDANGKPCSEARELQSRREPTKSSDDLLLLLKYVQMLFDGDGCGLFSKFTLPLLNVETGFQVNPSESMKRTCEQLDHENTVNCVMGVLLNSKFDDWLSSKCEQTSEGNYLLPKQYHGVIHTVAALGYDWALKPLLSSGVPINYRDANGWTALHWAARFGREEMVVVLLAAGAAAGALSDPTSEDPAAKTPASIASAYGFKGLSAYLSEAELTTHLHSLESIENGYRIDHASGEGTSSAVDRISDKYAHVHGGSDDQLALKDSLGAIRNAVQAAGRIQAAFRVFSFKKKQEMSLQNRDSYILPIREAGVGSRAMLEKAALSIQKNFRCWKKRKEFLKIRKNIIQIQARVRAHQERNKYKELLQSVGILEKAMLRWYRKGVGLRGFSSGAMPIDDEEEDDIVRVFRKQRVETAINEAVSRVSNIVGCPIARHEYRRMLEYTNKQSMESSKSASSWCL